MAKSSLLNKVYELKFETEQLGKSKVLLRVEKIYVFDNVWEARDQYDRFFWGLDDYEVFFDAILMEDKVPKPAKRISMSGNEQSMEVKEIYVYVFDSLSKAKEKEESLRKDLADLLDEKNKGKQKCQILREIRKKIAEVNNIEFHPVICTHEGPCSGTCPTCDAEIHYLDIELHKKRNRGESVVITGIAEEDIKKANITIPDGEEYGSVDRYVNMGEDLPMGDVSSIFDDDPWL